MSELVSGIDRLVEESALGKRFVEGMSGKSGLEGLIWWMDNLLYFIPENSVLVNSISRKITFFDTASKKCAKENLKRPEEVRQDEIRRMLGYTCVECNTVISALAYRQQEVCPKCGKEYEKKYRVVREKLRELCITPSPEAVMMWVAFEELADAYCEAYEAFKNVLGSLMKQRGWDNPLYFINLQMKDRLDALFIFAESGDPRWSKEERETLAFIVRGNLAGVGLKEAKAVIRGAIEVCKFGHLFNMQFASGADVLYSQARTSYTLLYNAVNAKISKILTVTQRVHGKRSITIEALENVVYFACALMNRNDWVTGKLSNEIVLYPLVKKKFPIFTDEEYVAMNCLVAPSGRGKTTSLGAIIYHAVEAGEYVFNILGDEKNGLTLAGIPLFHCEGKTGVLLDLLAKIGIYPKGIPTLNLTFLRENESIRKNMLHAHPPTIFDRIVEIDEAFDFGFEFYTGKKAVTESKDVVGNRGVLNILEEFALNMGYKRLCGLINVRNLDRKEKSEYDKEIKPEIEICTELFAKFCNFRQNSKSPSARLSIDELSKVAPVQHNIAGTDTSKSAAQFNAGVKEMRGMNASVDVATQSWNEIQPEAKKEKYNVFFRELPKSGDKSHSQIDLVLNDLDLINGQAERDIIKQMLETKTFPSKEHLWCWWNKDRGTIEIVRFNPPPFMINQPQKTNLEVFSAFEKLPENKERGVKVLLDSWDEVPRLRFKNTSYVQRGLFRPS